MRFLLILLFSASAWSCEKPLVINYGPYVSLLVVDQFLGVFHQSLAEKTGCKVSYQLHKDYDDYLLSLFRKETALALTPGTYYDVMIQRGYKLVASESRNKKRQIHVIAKKKSAMNTLKDLESHKVAIISSLSLSGSYFKGELDKLGLLPSVELHFNPAYESMVLSVMKGELDAAVVIQEYWNALDPNLRENHLKIIKTFMVEPDATFYVLKEFAHLSPIIKEELTKTIIDWDEPYEKAVGPELLKSLLQSRLDQFMRDNQ